MVNNKHKYNEFQIDVNAGLILLPKSYICFLKQADEKNLLDPGRVDAAIVIQPICPGCK
jgi:hypothetical protein